MILPDFISRRLAGRPVVQKIAANSGWLVFGHGLNMMLGLLVGAWVARYLGPGKLGLLAFAGAFVAFFMPMARLGLNGIAVRDMVREPERIPEILGTTFLLQVIGGSVTSVLAVVAARLLQFEDPFMQKLIAISSLGLIFGASETVDCYFQSRVQSKYSVLARIAAHGLISGVRVILILTDAPLVAFAWAMTVETACGALAVAVIYQFRGGAFSAWRVRVQIAVRLLSDSWPLMFAALVALIYGRISIIMLGKMTDEREVGIFAAALRITELCIFIPSSVVWSAFPSIVEGRTISDTVFFSRVQKLYNLMSFLAWIVVLPTCLLAKPLVALLYGPAFADSAPVLAVLIWTQFFVFPGMARNSFLREMNWTKMQLIASLAGCVVNVGLNLLLIPRHGVMGAAVAGVVTWAVVVLGTNFAVPRLFGTGRMLTKAMFWPKIW